MRLVELSWLGLRSNREISLRFISGIWYAPFGVYKNTFLIISSS